MKKVLIVDDQLDMRKLLKYSLGFRYDIKQAADTFEAANIVATWQPDLVLLDIMMPGVNGLQWCKIMKDEDLTKTTKIILISARATKDDISQGISSGADAYITKPFSPIVLLSAIENHLSH